MVGSVLLLSAIDIAPFKHIIAAGNTVQTRIALPDGYARSVVDPHSFGHYLRTLPVFEHGHTVHYYNGDEKRYNVYDAVIKMDVGTTDLQQCADAVMRLRAEYLLKQKRYNEISFTFTNGFQADYATWRSGNRIVCDGKNVRWVPTNEESKSYASFREYMNKVFMYAGTLSLAKQLRPRKIADIMPGDVFIKGGSPGHAMMVLDVAQDRSGNKIFLLAQSYMPAQEIHIVKNYNDLTLSPWYAAKDLRTLRTPEWTFSHDQLKTW